MDRKQLAEFLRSRRTALQPVDVGLPSGARRRAPGLRREEVASLSEMSTDYYTRLEQSRGPTPSATVLTAIARALKLSAPERDHLFLLAGRQPPVHRATAESCSPGLERLLGQLRGSLAQIVTASGETLAQTPLARALFGDDSGFAGLERSLMYRWFTLPDIRRIYPESDHAQHSRAFTSQLRSASVQQGPDSFPRRIVDSLLERSEEFTALWALHEIEVHHDGYGKRVLHPQVGVIDLDCQLLFSAGQAHGLLVLTAGPGTAAERRLRELSGSIVI
ncbi:helix-turn-helix domain-containing protein [Streptomyces sp. NEAU-H3]|uniref:helix-turn-helix transcriptional regulator n=1 Tax=Streptomyces sp. NEAU-H3 TaxID=2720636 RepID=UPI001439C6FF|nr:helix-turn-helix domain-containing protein [Streptomyces sp. NEAU-H3]NJA57127.1 helix-turn-helix domain-containing protein [Streptomyces sp. NEAU-H3]